MKVSSAFGICGVASVLASSCMVLPHDGDPVSHRNEEVRFSGYIQHPGEAVELQIQSGSGWVTFATAMSSTNAVSWLSGDWYPWIVDATLPKAGMYWKAEVDANGDYSLDTVVGQVRALNRNATVYTGDQGQWACVYDKLIYDALAPDVAYYQCAGGPSGSTTEVAVIASCNVFEPEGDGCFEGIDATPETDWPKDDTNGITEKLQGITHDDNFWYVSSSNHPWWSTTMGKFGRYPKDWDLTQTPPVIFDNPKPGWTHPGGMDYSDGWVYVAMEAEKGDEPYNAIGAFPTSNFTSTGMRIMNLPAGAQRTGGNFPWIARDPKTGFFYSSKFNDTDILHRYVIDFDPLGVPKSVRRCGTFKMSDKVDRVQGGAFSPSGRLYLATDPKDQQGIDDGLIKVVEVDGAMLGFDPTQCSDTVPQIKVSLVGSIYLQKSANALGQLYFEEVEDITVWDLDDGSAYQNRNLGHIHTILSGKDPGTDSLYLKHHRMDDPRDL